MIVDRPGAPRNKRLIETVPSIGLNHLPALPTRRDEMGVPPGIECCGVLFPDVDHLLVRVIPVSESAPELLSTSDYA